MVKYTTKSIQQQLHTPIIEKKNHKIFGIIDVRRSKLIKEKKQEKVEKVKQNRRYIKWLYCYIIMIIIITHYSKNTHLYRKKRINPKHYNR